MSTLKVNRIEPRTGDSVEIVGFEAGGGGKVLQVVQEVYSTQIATSSDSYVTSGLQASITPSSTSSKILVIAKVTAFYNTSGGGPGGGAIALFRDGANILDRCATSYSQNDGLAIDAGVNFMDSPNSTASLNYEIRFKSEFGTGNQFCHDNDTPSTMILMEVLA